MISQPAAAELIDKPLTLLLAVTQSFTPLFILAKREVSFFIVVIWWLPAFPSPVAVLACILYISLAVRIAHTLSVDPLLFVVGALRFRNECITLNGTAAAVIMDTVGALITF